MSVEVEMVSKVDDVALRRLRLDKVDDGSLSVDVELAKLSVKWIVPLSLLSKLNSTKLVSSLTVDSELDGDGHNSVISGSIMMIGCGIDEKAVKAHVTVLTLNINETNETDWLREIPKERTFDHRQNFSSYTQRVKHSRVPNTGNNSSCSTQIRERFRDKMYGRTVTSQSRREGDDDDWVRAISLRIFWWWGKIVMSQREVSFFSRQKGNWLFWGDAGRMDREDLSGVMQERKEGCNRHACLFQNLQKRRQTEKVTPFLPFSWNNASLYHVVVIQVVTDWYMTNSLSPLCGIVLLLGNSFFLWISSSPLFATVESFPSCLAIFSAQ